jgi:hypothetical protein
VLLVEPAGQYDPLLHVVTVEVAGFGQKLPAGHPVQFELTVVVHAKEVYWPEKQAVHAEQLGALIAVENDVPATHAAQVAAVVVLHAETRYMPAAHVLHAMGAVAPAGQ